MYYPIDSTTTTIRATLNNNNNCLSPTSIIETWCLIISKLLTFLSVNTLLALVFYPNITDCDSRYNRIDCELINRYDQLINLCVWRPQITTCEEINSSNTYFLVIIKIVIINSCVCYMINHLLHIMYKQLSIALNNRRLHWFYCLCSNTNTTTNNNIYQANIYQANSYHDTASSMQSSCLAQLLTILFFNTSSSSSSAKVVPAVVTVTLPTTRSDQMTVTSKQQKKQQSSRVIDDDDRNDGDDGKYDYDGGGGDYRSEGDDEYDTNAKNNILALDDYDRNLSYLLDDQVGDD